MSSSSWSAATRAGSAAVANEDWVGATTAPDGVVGVVLDGATVRTGTGCIHGVPWYVDQLGRALLDAARSATNLRVALADAIRYVANAHGPACDLSHPGTPSAGVGIVRTDGDHRTYLVLGDVSLVWADHENTVVVTDDRVSRTAWDLRRRADALPIGSKEKGEVLREMKLEELAARNRSDGYWIAAADPAAATHALVGSVPASAHRIALMSDGAARIMTFGAATWPEALATAAVDGPAALIDWVRRLEASDPLGQRWPRNKASDDASAILFEWR